MPVSKINFELFHVVHDAEQTCDEVFHLTVKCYHLSREKGLFREVSLFEGQYFTIQFFVLLRNSREIFLFNKKQFHGICLGNFKSQELLGVLGLVVPS